MVNGVEVVIANDPYSGITPPGLTIFEPKLNSYEMFITDVKTNVRPSMSPDGKYYAYKESSYEGDEHYSYGKVRLYNVEEDKEKQLTSI